VQTSISELWYISRINSTFIYTLSLIFTIYLKFQFHPPLIVVKLVEEVYSSAMFI
jgi:hypothetical protein